MRAYTGNYEHEAHATCFVVSLYIHKKHLIFQKCINISYMVLLRGKRVWVKWQCMVMNVESIKVAE